MFFVCALCFDMVGELEAFCFEFILFCCFGIVVGQPAYLFVK